VAVTPDELGESWREGRVHRPMIVHWNNKKVGQPDAGTDMVFHFGQLISHAAKTRNLRAGAIVGSGTVRTRTRSAAIAVSPKSVASRPSSMARRRPSS
jgi:2-keto-4-pentenoate hydratase/2-oxohepta-3-ene-1,7-dioic acid hydratase (catechol pathway)